MEGTSQISVKGKHGAKNTRSLSVIAFSSQEACVLPLFDGTGIRIGEFDHLLLYIRTETRAAIAPSTKRLMAAA